MSKDINLNNFAVFPSYRISKKHCKTTIENCLNIATEPENKGTMLVTTDFLRLQGNFYRSGVMSLSLLEETRATIFVTINFNLFCPFFDTFNSKIHDMNANGLTRKIFEDAVNPRGHKLVEDEISPQVLTMNQLAIGFYLCMVPLSLSFLAFFFEVLYHRIRNKIPQMLFELTTT